MTKRGKRYSPEFKENIVEMYHEENRSMSSLSREFEVTVSTISKWINNAEPIELDDGKTVTKQELTKLQKDYARLKEENEILKAAAVLLGKH